MITEFSKIFQIPELDILSQKRNPDIVEARHIYWYFLHNKAGYSFPKIARLNNRGYSAVQHGVLKIKTFLEIKDKRTVEAWEKVKGIKS